MSKYRKLPVIIEAITFDEFVQYGIAYSGNMVDGFPWSFDYKGIPVTHENNDTYIITPPVGEDIFFRRGEMLITDENGEISTCAMDVFNKTYELIME